MMDARQLLKMIEPLLKPIKNRVMMAIARGLIESVKDDGGVQLLKVSLLKDEVRDNIERIQQFGFTSNPPSGSEAVAVFVGGNREHGFVVACDHRPSRKKGIQPGECAIYTDDGTFIILKKNGQVEIKTATKVKIDVPNAEFTGNVKVLGKVEVTGNVESQAKVTAVGNVESQAKVKGTTGLETMADVNYGPGAASSVTALKTGFNTHTHLAGAIPIPDAPVLP